MKTGIFFIMGTAVLLSLMIIPIAFASVGVGVQPSKIKQELEGGSIYETSIIVFNSGDMGLEIGVTPEGDIAGFTDVEPTSYWIEPEPIPHVMPVKNGKIFNVKFRLPAVKKTTTYRGTLSAIGSRDTGAQFSGAVGVAVVVELIVKPPKSFWSYITPTQYAITGGVLGAIVLLAVLAVLRKRGYRLKVERRKK